MKKILGLDLGPNSIGWAVVQVEKESAEDTLFADGKILMAGSRIIPMSQDILNNYEKGASTSQTHDRTQYRQVRRQYERFHQRRERLNRVLMTIGYLPSHYADKLNRYGRLPVGEEPKLAWRMNDEGRFEFLFKKAFLEMVEDMKKVHPEPHQIPYDWTLYYLRKKALTQKLSPEEFAWVLHSFNQKRGFNAVRGKEDEETESPDKKQEYRKARLISIENTGEKLRGNPLYKLHFSDGVNFEIPMRRMYLAEGEDVEYIVTTKLDEDGMPKLNKQGHPEINYRIPNRDDAWTLNKLRAEFTIDQSHSTVGEYIYNALLNNPQQKIRGELVRTVDRRFYRDELSRILEKQISLHPTLQDRERLEECILALYPNNETHRNTLRTRDFKALLMDDVILYQRPLKSKKSLIDECKYEYRTYINKEGKRVTAGVKCASRSHPLFQEFRLWQFLENLRIYKRKSIEDGHLRTDVDVTSLYLSDQETYCALFEWLHDKKEIDQKGLLKFFKLKEDEYRWNYVEDRKYPAAETRSEMLRLLKKAGEDAGFLTADREMALWEILYSVNSQQELNKALRTFASKNNIDEDKFAQTFRKAKPYASDYCAFSTKALRRLLPLMRCGKFWDATAFDPKTKERIQRLIDGEADDNITERVREKVKTFRTEADFQGLPVWLASYVVYNRHSEAAEVKRWTTPEEMDDDIRKFRQHSLRNPIVEQVCLETLRTVRDIWKEVGSIDEIHVEMGREMRATAKEREIRHNRQLDNEQTNLRIKALLQEFMNPEFEVENVRPYSPTQQELMRIYEETVLTQEAGHIDEPIREIIRKFSQTDAAKRPTTAEVLRYKLWLEQKYRSPYTGEVIPLGKLFTPAYQIEHIIPQSVYYDNSYNNKVICEAEVNLLKGNLLGMPFIMQHAGETVQCSMGKVVTVFTPEAYRTFVEEHYKGKKQKILLSEDIPTNFTARQMNDTRYISRFIIGELSKLVRQQSPDGTLEQEAVSKNVVMLSGAVTDKLKKDWGLIDVWNGIIAPRFRRLNAMEQSNRFGHDAEKDGKRYFQIEMPLELQRGFQRKRIDHRHHAMDAIAIACATRTVVNYLNNDHAHEGAGREDIKRAVSRKRGGQWFINKPWGTFTQEVRQQIQQIIVSFKQNLRVINKTSNRYQHYNPATGRKELVSQRKGDNWAIRKPLHKESVYARVNLRSVKLVNFKTAYSHINRIVDKRLKCAILEGMARYNGKCTDKQILQYLQGMTEWKQYDFKKIKMYVFSDEEGEIKKVAIRSDLLGMKAKDIPNITDTGIQKILRNLLDYFDGNEEKAFSAEGIEYLNSHIQELNNGHPHQRIKKVRVSRTDNGGMFPVGITGNKSKKFVTAKEGTNLFFGVYENEKGNRVFETVPLNIAIERLKQRLSPVPEINEAGHRLLFILSPQELVYLLNEEERATGVLSEPLNPEQIYKVVSFSSNRCTFIPHRVAKTIVDKVEYESHNKIETIDGISIKNFCLPLEVDRLGRYRLK